eukprot:scaffold496_cov236-Pinguiococcus_pyrenoidosus.AAC.5
MSMLDESLSSPARMARALVLNSKLSAGRTVKSHASCTSSRSSMSGDASSSERMLRYRSTRSVSPSGLAAVAAAEKVSLKLAYRSSRSPLHSTR